MFREQLKKGIHILRDKETYEKIYRYFSAALERIPNWNTREKDHPLFIRYGVVIVLCFLAFGIKLMMNPILGNNFPFILFYSTILLGSWYGGFKPGVLATVVSALLAYSIFFNHADSSLGGKILALMVFMIEGLLISAVSQSMHKAYQNYEEKDRYMRYYASIAQNISDAVISTDMHDVIQSWNKGAESLYGWTQQEVIGKPLHTIVPAMYAVQQKKEMQNDLFTKGTWKDEVSHKRKNGSRMYVLTSMSLIRGEDDKPLGIVSVNRDISDRKKT